MHPTVGLVTGSIGVRTCHARPGLLPLKSGQSCVPSGTCRRTTHHSPLTGRTHMACTCVVGLQWGDEAKGKIVDLLTQSHDYVVRYNGGANAGHTVVKGGKTYKLSLLPTGVLIPRIVSVI